MNEEQREQIERNGRNSQRILEDELFRAAIASITNDATTKLVLTDAGDTVAILRAQETVKVCNELMSTLLTHMQMAEVNKSRPKMA